MMDGSVFSLYITTNQIANLMRGGVATACCDSIQYLVDLKVTCRAAYEGSHQSLVTTLVYSMQDSEEI